MVCAARTGHSTGLGFDLAWFSSPYSQPSVSLVFTVLYVFTFFLHTLPFAEWSLVRFSLDLVD